MFATDDVTNVIMAFGIYKRIIQKDVEVTNKVVIVVQKN